MIQNTVFKINIILNGNLLPFILFKIYSLGMVARTLRALLVNRNSLDKKSSSTNGLIIFATILKQKKRLKILAFRF